MNNPILFIGIGLVVFFTIMFIIFILTGSSEKGLEKSLTKYGNIAARAQHNIISSNEEILKDSADKTANIHKDAVKTIVSSIKEGLSDDDSDATMYCKYCRTKIDSDSKFCKKCGKPL